MQSLILIHGKIVGNFSIVMRPSGIISAHFIPCLYQCSRVLLFTTSPLSLRKEVQLQQSLEVRLEIVGDFAVVLAKGSVLRDLEKPSHSTEKTATDFLRKLWGTIRQNLVCILQNESLMHNCTLLPFPSMYSKLPSV